MGIRNLGGRLGLPLQAALFIGAALDMGCTASLPEPQAADVSRASTTGAPVTLRDLETGRALYVSKCSGCHQLHLPEAMAPERWPVEVSSMRETQKVAMSEDEERLIIAYLVGVSSR